jgi:hypothetical protein
MTTTVTIDAHCAADTEVHVLRFGVRQEVDKTVLQDGEMAQVVVHDGIGVTVFEVKRESGS